MHDSRDIYLLQYYIVYVKCKVKFLNLKVVKLIKISVSLKDAKEKAAKAQITSDLDCETENKIKVRLTKKKIDIPQFSDNSGLYF